MLFSCVSVLNIADCIVWLIAISDAQNSCTKYTSCLFVVSYLFSCCRCCIAAWRSFSGLLQRSDQDGVALKVECAKDDRDFLYFSPNQCLCILKYPATYMPLGLNKKSCILCTSDGQKRKLFVKNWIYADDAVVKWKDTKPVEGEG